MAKYKFEFKKKVVFAYLNNKGSYVYLAKKYTEYPLSHIGSRLGGKDHATVHYACKMISQQVEIDKSLRAQVDEIEQSLKS